MGCSNPVCPCNRAVTRIPLEERPVWDATYPLKRSTEDDPVRDGDEESHRDCNDGYAQITAKVSLRCPCCKWQLLFCDICRTPLQTPSQLLGQERNLKCGACGFPTQVAGEKDPPPGLSADKVRQLQVSLCGRRAYYAAKQVEFQRLSQILSTLRPPAALPLLLGPPVGDGPSSADVETPDFKSYLGPQPGGAQVRAFEPAQRQKNASQGGALDDSGKSATPSSDDKKSTGSEIRGRGAPTPIASRPGSAHLSQPPAKRRKLEMQTTAFPGNQERGRGGTPPGCGEGTTLVSAHTRSGADVAPFFQPREGGQPRLETDMWAAFGSHIGLAEGLKNDGWKGVWSDSQDMNQIPGGAAEEAASAGQRKGLEELSSGGNSRACDESGSGQHVSQDAPHALHGDAPHLAPGAKLPGLGRPKEHRGQKSEDEGGESGMGREATRSAGVNPTPALNKDSEDVGAAAQPCARESCLCPCGRELDSECRPCRAQETEAAMALCQYQLLCLQCAVTEAHDRFAQDPLPFDRTDLALLQAQVQAMSEGGGELWKDTGAVLKEAGRFLELRPELLRLKVASAVGVVSRRTRTDLGGFSQRHPSSPMVGLRTVRYLLEERSAHASTCANTATSTFESLLPALSDLLEKVRKCAARTKGSASTIDVELAPAGSAHVDLHSAVLAKEKESRKQEREGQERRQVDQTCRALQEVYRTIWRTIGGFYEAPPCRAT